jgi:hypothetical protein
MSKPIYPTTKEFRDWWATKCKKPDEASFARMFAWEVWEMKTKEIEEIQQSGFWGRTAARLTTKLDKAEKTLDLIERGRYQNGDKLSKIGMRSLSCSCMVEIGVISTVEMEEIGREPVRNE